MSRLLQQYYCLKSSVKGQVEWLYPLLACDIIGISRIGKGGYLMNLTSDVVWKIFVTTGSVTAYLLYKQLSALTKQSLH